MRKKWEVACMWYGGTIYYQIVRDRRSATSRWYDAICHKWVDSVHDAALFRSRRVAAAVAAELNRQERRMKR